jgi:hypothetical protein
MREAVQRHRKFIEREASAINDSDALRIFADFIISESSIRRQRYAKAWEAGSFDVDAVRKSLSEPMCSTTLSSKKDSDDLTETSLVQSSPEAISAVTCSSHVEPGWWNNYRPCLSPIASMSMSNDEMSSRGRAPSRWWESQTGSGSGGSGRKVRRSKRESKYMSLPIHEAMQLWSPENNHHGAHPLSGPPMAYGPNEYPPEKVGWHEQQPAQLNAPIRTASIAREGEKLDISRLVTLPPPYPRHYPAVNNSHPDLTLYRTTVRSVTDLAELQNTKQKHQVKLNNLQQAHKLKVVEDRRKFRTEMNTRLEEGTISYAKAADAEAIHLAEEHELEKDQVQAEFDSYQDTVFNPMRSILLDRIDITTTCIDDLRSKLFDSAQNEDPNQPQEGGDEQPELLEKLTQLKWLFEAREQLHREVYDLLTERNERYMAIVTLRYRQSNNQEKLAETEAFFLRDVQDRQLTFATETLRRFESFLDVIEKNVGRGVEVQLSAFWDIAPSLLTVLQKIPDDLRSFSVKIPPKEYEENPSLYQYPLQYLYSLLSHAEKSTYQFIESQTNLLCLLHEVKIGLMNANCRFMEIQRIKSGESKAALKREMEESRVEEERILTADLKDKVAMVEGQWAEALGNKSEAVKGRVQEWLMREGGWEDIVQMEQA